MVVVRYSAIIGPLCWQYDVEVYACIRGASLIGNVRRNGNERKKKKRETGKENKRKKKKIIE